MVKISDFSARGKEEKERKKKNKKKKKGCSVRGEAGRI